VHAGCLVGMLSGHGAGYAEAFHRVNPTSAPAPWTQKQPQFPGASWDSSTE
jgi:hypothetical protein